MAVIYNIRHLGLNSSDI